MNDLRPKLITLYFMAMILISTCQDTEILQEPDPLSNFNFAFLQASEKFYFSITTSRSFNNSKLDSVVVVWMGTDSSSVPDTIKLFDDGTLGDIIPNDNIFSRRIAKNIVLKRFGEIQSCLKRIFGFISVLSGFKTLGKHLRNVETVDI